MSTHWKKLYPYLIAVVMVALLIVLRGNILGPILGGRAPYGFFILSVIVSAWFGGFVPGLLATVLSLVAGLLFFEPSPGELRGFIAQGMFTLNGILISAVCESLQRSRHRADSARKLVERGREQLVASEERQRNILNAIPHLVWTANASGQIDYINQRWQDQLGLTLKDARENGWKEVVHPDDLQRLTEAARHASTDGAAFVHEFRVRLPDGQYHWHLVNVHPSRGQDGEFLGWFGTATDVDKARRAVEELRISEERFRRLADSAPILIWMSDTVGAFTWFNRPWLDYTGALLEEETGSGWHKGIHPEDRERLIHVITDSLRARQPFEIDFRLRRRDGVYRWIMNRGLPLFGVDGVFLGYMGGCVDINERKEAEEQSEALLRIEQNARREAERTALLKDEFLATVSHEMRTPLTAMLGWVQLLRTGSIPPETVPQALETVERNARAQAKLIDDLLDMSRILSGRLRIDVQTVNIIETVEAAISAAEPAAAAKKIQLHRNFDTHLSPVAGDPTRLQQVFWNLLSNAIKFTPSGGDITVAIERSNSHLEISVSDTGEGILPEFLPHVFDRFRQQDASTMRKHQGLGLGLAIVKHLVELHGGQVRAKSPGPGRGATFSVALPIAAVQTEGVDESYPLPAERERVEEPVPTLLGTRVLVVEDDDDARELLRSILAQSGASVRTAASAREAIAQFDLRPPDVVVSDIGMPVQDGYDLIRQIRSREDTAGGHTPALALTAFARSDDRRRAIKAGFQMHLAKPVEPAELITVVASLTGR